MNTFWKTISTAALLLIMGSVALGVYHAYETNYFTNASFVSSGVMVLSAIIILYLSLRGLRSIWTNAPLFIMLLLAQGCHYAKSNQQVLVSDDCGVSWRKIDAGESVPAGAANPCYMRVVIPNFPMQGSAIFVTNLAGKVRVETHIDYDYSINNSLAFIKEAKTVGEANVDPEKAINPSAFESAENRVIDKRIRDVAKELFLTQDIIELDQAQLEDTLLDSCNKRLEPLGVKLNFVTLTFDTDEQTRQAIDVSTAMKIYESKGLGELGSKVMIARAGAAKIMVENKTPQAEPAPEAQ